MVLQFVANVGIAFLLLIADGFLTVFERLLALRKTQLCLRQNKQSAKCCAVCFVVAFGVYEKSIFLRQMLLQTSLLNRNVIFAVNRLFFSCDALSVIYCCELSVVSCGAMGLKILSMRLQNSS